MVIQRGIKWIVIVTIILSLTLATYMVAFSRGNETEETMVWSETDLIQKALASDKEIKKMEMDLELAKMSEKDIRDLEKMDVDEVIQFQSLDPYRTKSKTELRTEAKISQQVTPLQYHLNVNNINRQIAYRKMELKKNVKSALYDYLKNKDEYVQVELAVKQAEQTYHNIKAQYEKGLVTALDVNKTKNHLDTLNLQLQMVKANLETSRMRLNKDIGQALNEAIEVKTEDINWDTEDIKAAVKHDQLESFVTIALEHRPDYLAMVENTEILKTIHEIYQKNYTFITDEAIRTKREKEMNYQKALLDMEDQKQEIYLQVKQQLDYLHYVLDQYELQKNAVENAKESLRITELLYNNGMVRSDELLGAQLHALTEENKLVESKYNVQTQLAQFELVIGKTITE